MQKFFLTLTLVLALLAPEMNATAWPEGGVECLRPLATEEKRKEIEEQAIVVLREKPDVRNFVEHVLNERYKAWGLPTDLATRIIEILIRNEKKLDIAMTAISKTVIDFQRDKKWKTSYGEYKAAKYRVFYSILEPFLTELREGAVVVDVGAGTNTLGKEIAQHRPDLVVIGTDSNDNHVDYHLPNLAFYQNPQGDPLQFPTEITNNSVDAIIMSDMMHHISQADLPFVLKEARRIARRGARLIVFESTFSEKLPLRGEHTDTALSEEFLQLVREHGELFAKDFFTVLDWWGNILVQNIPEMSMPYSFYSVDMLEQMLHAQGFNMVYVQQVGFLKKAFHSLNLCILVFEFTTLRPGSVTQPSRGVLLESI